MQLPCTLHPQTSAGQTHSPRASCWERIGEGKGVELAVHCPGGTWTLTFTLHSDPGGQSPSYSHYSGKLMWQTERVVQRWPRPLSSQPPTAVYLGHRWAGWGSQARWEPPSTVVSSLPRRTRPPEHLLPGSPSKVGLRDRNQAPTNQPTSSLHHPP